MAIWLKSCEDRVSSSWFFSTKQPDLLGFLFTFSKLMDIIHAENKGANWHFQRYFTLTD